MTWWIILVPFISALIGWLINSLAVRRLFRPYHPKKFLGFTIQGVIPKQQQLFAEKIGKYAGANFFSFDSIEQKIADPANLDKIMPVIEEHVDEFLRVKLVKEMPMIGMFIGDKTIATMKKIFMQELSSLFPEIMKSYAANLKAEFNPQKIITEKIAGLPMSMIEDIAGTQLNATMRNFKIAGAATGFAIGLIQIAFTFWIGAH